MQLFITNILAVQNVTSYISMSQNAKKTSISPLGSLCVSSWMSNSLAKAVRSGGITQQEARLTWLLLGFTWYGEGNQAIGCHWYHRENGRSCRVSKQCTDQSSLDRIDNVFQICVQDLFVKVSILVSTTDRRWNTKRFHLPEPSCRAAPADLCQDQRCRWLRSSGYWPEPPAPPMLAAGEPTIGRHPPEGHAVLW